MVFLVRFQEPSFDQGYSLSRSEEKAHEVTHRSEAKVKNQQVETTTKLSHEKVTTKGTHGCWIMKPKTQEFSCLFLLGGMLNYRLLKPRLDYNNTNEMFHLKIYIIHHFELFNISFRLKF